MFKYLSDNQLEFNGYVFTRDKKTGYYLSSKPINGKRIRLHRYLYTCYYGEIPEGYDVHHIDGDRENNNIANLAVHPGSKHKAFHFREAALNPAKLAKWPEVRQKGSDSHRRPDMRLKQAERSREQWVERKTAEPKKYACKECSGEFTSYHTAEPMFCSKKCKARDFRRRFKEEHGYGYDKKIRPDRDKARQDKKR